MMEFDNKLSFFESVKNYLLNMRSKDEYIESTGEKKEYLVKNRLVSTKTFYLGNGLHSLGIRKNCYVVAVYLNSPDELEEIFQMVSKNDNTVVVTNLSERYCKEYLSKKVKKSNLLFAPQLVNKKGFDRKKYNINAENNDQEPFKKKCIHVDRFNELLNFAIRQKIVESLFSEFLELNASYFISNIKQKSLLPFKYLNKSENIEIIFIESNYQLKKIEYNSEETFIVKLRFYEDDNEKKSLNIKVINTSGNNHNSYYLADIIKDYTYIKKINIDFLISLVEKFNRINGSFYIDDFVDLYKYRKFNKNRYTCDKEKIDFLDSTIFKYPQSNEIEIGSRSAFEDKKIFFSNYKQLNDPFDLLFRVPKKLFLTPDDKVYADTYKEKTNHPFLTFCVTSKYDNILMWSHYGYSHTGTCVNYPMFDLIKAIESDTKCAICFYGKIKYSPNRPSFYLTKSLFRFIGIDVAILMFNVISMFSKYRDWKYEDEYRFLILPSSGNEAEFKNGHLMEVDFKELYLGCYFEDAYKAYFDRLGLCYTKMKLSNSKYKLEI